MALVIAGERSGVGKTTVTLMMLAGLRYRGVEVQSYKVGPDYIDPMFHSYVTGRACRNLDPVLTSETYVQECFHKHGSKVEVSVVEGVMGLFDGVVGKTATGLPWGSTAHVADLIDAPIALVLDCSRTSGSIAAIAYGFMKLHPHLRFAGLILNRIGSDRHLEIIKDALKPLGLPILGVLRREADITIPDRHLGLIPTEELDELERVLERLGSLANTCFDWELLLPILRDNSLNLFSNGEISKQKIINHQITNHNKTKPRILIARDRAFNFYYQDNLDLLVELGAELVFWSPLKEEKLPENIQGMYFGGGFPEVFAEQLSRNHQGCLAVKNAISSGIPTIAECGGLMYLCVEITDFDGKTWPMVGILPATAIMGKKLSLGYRQAVGLKNSLLVTKGEKIIGHEFHRSYLEKTSNSDPIDLPLFTTYRIDSQELIGEEGWNHPPNLLASYIHMHWGANRTIAERFLKLAVSYLSA